MAKYEITGQYPKARRDHAANAFYDAVYDEIKANAGLDTKWGHAAARGLLSSPATSLPVLTSDFLRLSASALIGMM